MTREEYFCNEYVESIYYFCLKKVGSREEAEDLAGEICVEVLSALKRGIVIENFNAYVWRIARNVYAKWAVHKHNRLEKEYFDDDALEDVGTTENMEDAFILKDSINALRRELSLVEREYREILVAYYLNQEKISDIAKRLSIPEGTVKTKLYTGRMRLRGGFEMARHFGKLSYAPEDIVFTQCGGKSRDNVPDRFLYDDLNSKICKNILIQAYDNPSTLEMLSIELGIALPYLEPFVEQMTEATLLLKSGTNGKSATYETNFVILSAAARRNMIDKLASIQKDFVKAAEEYLTKARELQLQAGISILGDYQDYEEQKYTLACRLADDMQWSVYDKRNLNFGYDTKRPNGGSWDIMAHQVYSGKEFYWVGHSCGKADDFALTMFVTEEEACGAYDKTMLLSELRTLKKVFEAGNMELSEREVDAISEAVRKREDGSYEIAFGVYNSAHNRDGLRYGVPIESYDRDLLPLWNKMLALTEEYISFCEEIVRREIPGKLKSQFNFCIQAIPYLRHMVVEGLLDSGYLKPEKELSHMIGVYTEI